jgi:site-specific DNA-methyltransferase (adenine-specific)
LDVLPTLAAVDHIIMDPPYSEHQHKSVRSSGRLGMLDGNGRMSPCATRRVVDLQFDHLDVRTRRAVAREAARMTRRWVMAFSDDESSWLWRLSFVASGLEYIRTALWRRDGAPQFTGDRPASGHEQITLAHPKGRKKWNGGGKCAIYDVPIVRYDRVHTTQKPIGLMLAIVADFTDPDDLVLDPFCGSGTTGVACLRLGRRFLGIEKDAEYAKTAAERLEAETYGSTLNALRAGQEPLFR